MHAGPQAVHQNAESNLEKVANREYKYLPYYQDILLQTCDDIRYLYALVRQGNSNPEIRADLECAVSTPGPGISYGAPIHLSFIHGRT